MITQHNITKQSESKDPTKHLRLFTIREKTGTCLYIVATSPLDALMQYSFYNPLFDNFDSIVTQASDDDIILVTPSAIDLSNENCAENHTEADREGVLSLLQ